MCMPSYTFPPDSGVSRYNFDGFGAIAGIQPYACILFPNLGVINV